MLAKPSPEFRQQVTAYEAVHQNTLPAPYGFHADLRRLDELSNKPIVDYPPTAQRSIANSLERLSVDRIHMYSSAMCLANGPP
ncbi:hypothetical protein NAV33_00980 [Pseudomonas stutzeri]|uniref:hypothetical protein n=1 Tax=Stutzerimonas stutzeri TaxID=316 RepID=UPI002109B64B|nr:hypothetical protein [Stutzerimonas stutzeri]MCQ4310475.1 hypothetical protein [Stutzerimonas stutzeri]